MRQKRETTKHRILHIINSNTVDPVYSERVGPAKSVHNNRVFTINVFNLTIS